jgi:acyl-coenzyme A thioesterase PaaI-like protein
MTRISENPTDLAAINAANDSRASGRLGVRITGIGDDFARGELEVERRTHQPIGLLDNGVSCVLAETLGSIAAVLACDDSANSKIRIIGNGNVGGTLARGLEAAGHNVRTVDNDHEPIRQVASRAEVVMLAVPFGAVNDVIGTAGEVPNGKTAIEVTNVLNAELDLLLGLSTSGGVSRRPARPDYSRSAIQYRRRFEGSAMTPRPSVASDGVLSQPRRTHHPH